MPGSPTEDAAGGVGGGPLTVAQADFLWFADRALTQLTEIVRQLGDDLANRTPALPGANSPYVILTHCLGVVEYWGGATVAERTVVRDRAAEFTAHGDVDALVRRADEARRRLREDVATLDARAVPAGVRRDPADPVPYSDSKGAVLLHILEELYQHLGHMELTRDVLLAGPAE